MVDADYAPGGGQPVRQVNVGGCEGAIQAVGKALHVGAHWHVSPQRKGQQLVRYQVPFPSRYIVPHHRLGDAPILSVPQAYMRYTRQAVLGPEVLNGW